MRDELLAMTIDTATHCLQSRVVHSVYRVQCQATPLQRSERQEPLDAEPRAASDEPHNKQQTCSLCKSILFDTISHRQPQQTNSSAAVY